MPHPSTVSRRSVLRFSGSAGMLAVATAVTQACAPASPTSTEDANGVVLRPGFTSRVIARGGETVPGTDLEFRIFPDGAATFPDAEVPGGWYLTVNHEVPLQQGGVTSIRFAPDGTVVGARSICDGTSSNCSGGPTPWGTWLSGEEWDGGYIWECEPTGASPARRLDGMGAFKHEAAAVAADGRVYLTEDQGDGGFYRFTPDVAGELGSGLLEVACGDAPGPVTWQAVPRPRPTWDQTPCRRQVDGSMHFDGGEGIATDGSLVWFSTKGDDRIWQYDAATAELTLRYQAGRPSILSGVDNLWFDQASGGLLVAEDGDDMEVVVLRPDNTVEMVAAVPGHGISEIAGPCFSPDGQRLYFSSQRAPVGPLSTVAGVLYEVRGPFDELMGRS